MKLISSKSFAYSTVLGILAVSVMAATSTADAASHANTVFIEEQDLNGDGKVSFEEFKAGRQVGFMKMNFDGNGSLSEAEYVGEFEGRLMQALGKIADYEKRTGDYQRQMRQAKVRFGVLDSDKNSVMTYEEYLASGLKMFERHDRDKDGFVTTRDREILEKEAKDGKGDDFIAP